MTVRQILNAAFGLAPQNKPDRIGEERPRSALSLQALTDAEYEAMLARAQAGDVEAQFILGRLLFRGLGVPADPVEAFKWLSLAAAQGDSKSAQLGGLVIQALNPDQISEGRRRIAAFCEHRGTRTESGTTSLAEMPSAGLASVTPPNLAMPRLRWVLGTAVVLMLSATVVWRAYFFQSEAPDVTGGGIRPDEVAVGTPAIRTLGLAPPAPASATEAGEVIDVAQIQAEAERGDPNAQFNIGLLHATGTGLKQDYVAAAKWYLLAAQKGHVLAQNNLAILYADGHGMPKDIVQAYKWLHLSAEGGNESAARNREKLAPSMTREQIADALKQANSLVKK